LCSGMVSNATTTLRSRSRHSPRAVPTKRSRDDVLDRAKRAEP